MNTVAAVLALVMLAYLGVALLWPEKLA